MKTDNFTYKDIDTALARREVLMDLLTPNGRNWNELEELLEIESALTLDEEQ